MIFLPDQGAAANGLAAKAAAEPEPALAWAARFAAACRCAQEVREIMFDPES